MLFNIAQTPSASLPQAGDAGWLLTIMELIGGLPEAAPEPYVSHLPSGIGRCAAPRQSHTDRDLHPPYTTWNIVIR